MTTSAGDLRALLDQDRLIARLQELVRARSENPPGEEARAAEVAAEMCDSLGMEVTSVEVDPGRPSIIARKVFGDGPTLGYCSHIDVVPAGSTAEWGFPPFDAVVSDGQLHGRGSADAKGPVAAAIEATKILLDAGVPLVGTLELELVADEETMGFKGAGHLVADKTIHPDIAIVGEPTSLKIVRAQRGRVVDTHRDDRSSGSRFGPRTWRLCDQAHERDRALLGGHASRCVSCGCGGAEYQRRNDLGW
jgi:acetylornithine deacetylase/succinyl-diaminopimelate desuccinylase